MKEEYEEKYGEDGRSPHGECGLKYFDEIMSGAMAQSLPAWGVWIEIGCHTRGFGRSKGRSPHGECGLKSEEIDVKLRRSESLPAWGVWIEIHVCENDAGSEESLPAWGVWIEISWVRPK